MKKSSIIVMLIIVFFKGYVFATLGVNEDEGRGLARFTSLSPDQKENDNLAPKTIEYYIRVLENPNNPTYRATRMKAINMQEDLFWQLAYAYEKHPWYQTLARIDASHPGHGAWVDMQSPKYWELAVKLPWHPGFEAATDERDPLYWKSASMYPEHPGYRIFNDPKMLYWKVAYFDKEHPGHGAWIDPSHPMYNKLSRVYVNHSGYKNNKL